MICYIFSDSHDPDLGIENMNRNTNEKDAQLEEINNKCIKKEYYVNTRGGFWTESYAFKSVQIIISSEQEQLPRDWTISGDGVGDGTEGITQNILSLLINTTSITAICRSFSFIPTQLFSADSLSVCPVAKFEDGKFQVLAVESKAMQLKISQNVPPKRQPATYPTINTVEGLDFHHDAVPL
ncbi:uncharacterized protein C8R40DRAFT_1068942 [Lentinula edodes]|uniref:uncharacterized protein n=1 Tax=Lentinula edodes TaxID=5353 RepID=UPI001E8E0218|nr:uncharacterized protein C8R40DRAFT_1068942 [Lentinula edodes]KAH7876162.1 hypothetical protein C8R40DRAFT_1068942 [Lentinula edodes]